jgi:hypothetical protein
MLVIAGFCVAAIMAQPGPSYELKQGLTSSGGGVAKDAATSREITGTIAQPIAGTRSGGGVFTLWGGFHSASASVPTASMVSISGSVTSAGRGVRSATVTITDQAGLTRSVVTGPRGSYSIDDVIAGGVYIISVVSRRFTFAPQVVSVSDNLTGIDFISP